MKIAPFEIPESTCELPEGYLWNDDDKSQIGVGVDRLGTKRDGVMLKWKSDHTQTSCAKLGRYKLETVFWHTEYEALFHWDICDHSMEYTRGHKSKIKAQLAAEKLLLKHIIQTSQLLKFLKPK